MKKMDDRIKQAFTEEEALPEIVEKGIQDACKLVYARSGRKQHGKNVVKLQAAKTKAARLHPTSVLKVAGFFAVCFAVLGTTAFAVQAILNRYERMKSMEEGEKTQIYEDAQGSGGLLYLSSRNFTEEELRRFDELEEAYRKDEVFPARNLRRLEEGEEYYGVGVCLAVTIRGGENIMYLPDRELTDEELLEIIEYNEKIDYVLREENQKQEFGEELWEERLSKMTDEEVDHFYLACYGASKSALYGGFCRDGKNSRTGAKVLSETEEKRYQDMTAAYRENNRIPTQELVLIERPEEYDGESVAYCRWNSVYYVPLGELTEEDFLEIIDFETKANYSSQRIDEDISYGRRSGLPKEEEAIQEFAPLELNQKAFASVAGTEKAMSDAGVGDIVRFGSYEQDGNTENGAESVSWYVLDETEDALMLLSVEVLDGKRYHEKSEMVGWKDSSLREWLNGEFFETAFSEQERNRIIQKEVVNNFGDNSKDLVTLLSTKECMEYFGIDPEEPGADPRKHYEGIYEYGISKKEKENRLKRFLNAADPRRFGKATECNLWDGVQRGCLHTIFRSEVEDLYMETNVDISNMIGYCRWWLRDVDPDCPDGGTFTVNVLSYWNSAYVNGFSGVRPVIWMKK